MQTITPMNFKVESLYLLYTSHNGSIVNCTLVKLAHPCSLADNRKRAEKCPKAGNIFVVLLMKIQKTVNIKDVRTQSSTSCRHLSEYLVSLSKWTAFICTCLPTSINTIYLPSECSWPVVLCGFAHPIYYLQYVEFFDMSAFQSHIHFGPSLLLSELIVCSPMDA